MNRSQKITSVFRLALGFSPSEYFILLSLCIYVVSLAGVPYYHPDSSNLVTGIELVAAGWITLTAFKLTWCANPLLWFAWIALKRQKGVQALASAALALMLAVEFGLRPVVFGDYRTEPDPALLRLSYGYWLWCASIVTAGLGALYILTIGRRRSHRSDDSIALG